DRPSPRRAGEDGWFGGDQEASREISAPLAFRGKSPSRRGRWRTRRAPHVAVRLRRTGVRNRRDMGRSTMAPAGRPVRGLRAGAALALALLLALIPFAQIGCRKPPAMVQEVVTPTPSPTPSPTPRKPRPRRSPTPTPLPSGSPEATPEISPGASP